MLRRQRLQETETLETVIDLREEVPQEGMSPGSPDETPQSIVGRIKGSVTRELRHPAAFLFPLRLFIGIGWLRAFAEKVISSEWFDGEAVGAFLDTSMAIDSMAFPLYGQLIETVLRPGSRWIGLVVMGLQFLIGLAILIGTYTNLALLIGVGLNVNFILAGRIAPSAFYIVIQTALFVTGAGGILGLDGVRARSGRASSILLVAHPDLRYASRWDKAAVIGLVVVAAGLSWFGFAHATDLSPSGVFDPALVLGTVMGLGALSLIILRIRLSVFREPSPAMA
jgi:thiosulfate dehydrogenase [quinone] large subunit